MVASAGVVASCLHYYYGSLLRNVRVDRPIVIHAHAVVFTGWLVPNPPARRVVAFFLWSAPVLIAIVHDARHARIVHPVYVLTLALFAFRLWSPLVVVATPQWKEITTRVLTQGGS